MKLLKINNEWNLTLKHLFTYCLNVRSYNRENMKQKYVFELMFYNVEGLRVKHEGDQQNL